MNTVNRINRLSAERSALYRLAANSRRGDTGVLRRIQEIGREIEALWEQRRRERAGCREGIDLVVDRVYERTYGRGFEDAVTPPPVAEEKETEGEAVVLAA